MTPPSSPPSPTPLFTGAELLVKSLEAVGVETIFGIPGGAILPAYDPLFDSSLRHVLVRHEQGAGHAATGWAAATGKVGVCIATSGPGATNLVTPLADAYMDSIPLVAITGQVASSSIGTDAFQEADIIGITMPITKHSFSLRDPAEIPAVIQEAFFLAASGRPGPVLVDIPKDVLQSRAPFLWEALSVHPGYTLPLSPDPAAVLDALSLLAAASRPVLYVGGGVLKAEASPALRAFQAATGIPVVTTLMARGAFPDSHPLHLGMPGMHGSVAAVTALQRADLIFALGARFDDRVTGRLDSFAPLAKVVHVDVDPAEIGKLRHAEVPLPADARLALEALLDSLPAIDLPDLSPWQDTVRSWQERYPLGYTSDPDHLSPQYVIERLGALAQAEDPSTVFVAGVGQHQMWGATFVSYEHPRTWLNSGGLGTMGYAIPAAMGAKAALPDTLVWAIDGDGCFQMTSQELITCAIEGIPVKIAIINNGNLGMVRQWQTLFYDSRYSSTSLHPRADLRVPDFVLLALAMGCEGLRCERAEDVDDTIRAAMAITDRPVVVDFIVGPDAMVWPMVAAGASNDDIQHARDLAPDWEADDLSS